MTDLNQYKKSGMPWVDEIIKELEDLRTALLVTTEALDDIIQAVAMHHKELRNDDGSNSVHVYISRRYGQAKDKIKELTK